MEQHHDGWAYIIPMLFMEIVESYFFFKLVITVRGPQEVCEYMIAYTLWNDAGM